LGVSLIVGGVLVVLLFRGLVDQMIKAEIPLRAGSTVTEAWLHPPVRPLLKIYFFNTTNPAGFLRGEKAILQEVGPYIYEEKWDKVDVDWQNDTVSYRLRKFYKWRQDLSYPLQETDLINIPNVPMFASVNQMSGAGRLVQQALGSMLEILKQDVFNATTVRPNLIYIWPKVCTHLFFFSINSPNLAIPIIANILFEAFSILLFCSGEGCGLGI